MAFSDIPDNIGIRKVLIEKHSRNWMQDWLLKQQSKYTRTKNYEDAAKLRDLNRTFFLIIENNPEYYHLKNEFDEIFFYLYENLE